MKRYPIVIEHGPNGCSAYSPDLPGSVAAATSEEELLALMTEAIEFHIEGLKLHGQPFPSRPPVSTTSRWQRSHNPPASQRPLPRQEAAHSQGLLFGRK
jgi:predicted RNase H-like HicB family nuclease